MPATVFAIVATVWVMAWSKQVELEAARAGKQNLEAVREYSEAERDKSPMVLRLDEPIAATDHNP